MSLEPMTSAALVEYLRETGSDGAAALFNSQDGAPLAAWQAASEPLAMLELLAALRPASYTGRLRSYLCDAYDLAAADAQGSERTLEVDEELEQALAAAAARAEGSLALDQLPRPQRLRRAAKGAGPAQMRAAKLIAFVCARNVAWGAESLSRLLGDLAYSHRYNAELKAAGAEQARQAAEQAKQETLARLAKLLRHRFPDPFSG